MLGGSKGRWARGGVLGSRTLLPSSGSLSCSSSLESASFQRLISTSPSAIHQFRSSGIRTAQTRTRLPQRLHTPLVAVVTHLSTAGLNREERRNLFGWAKRKRVPPSEPKPAPGPLLIPEEAHQDKSFKTEIDGKPQEVSLVFYQDVKSTLSVPFMVGLGLLIVDVQLGVTLFQNLAPEYATACLMMSSSLAMVILTRVSTFFNQKVVRLLYAPATQQVCVMRPRFFIPGLVSEIIPLKDFAATNPSIWNRFITRLEMEQKTEGEGAKSGAAGGKATGEIVGVPIGVYKRDPKDGQPIGRRVFTLGFTLDLVKGGAVDVWKLDYILRGQEPVAYTAGASVPNSYGRPKESSSPTTPPVSDTSATTTKKEDEATRKQTDTNMPNVNKG